MTTANEVRPEWTSADLDHTLDLLERGAVEDIRSTELDASRAGRFLEALHAKERELDAVTLWYQQRRAALTRGIEWMRANLEAYARMEYARTGLRRFPVGRGEAAIRKAQTVVRWPEEILPWMDDLIREHPDVVTTFSHKKMLTYVRWSEPRADGISEAAHWQTGEILEGLVRDARLGQVTVSVRIGKDEEETE